jgi:shikimate dehydrogenase
MNVRYAEVIGDPVAHSKSPLIHQFWLGKLGIAGEYRRTRVTADELPLYLATRRVDPDWRGCNLTMPLKREVVPLLSALDNAAARIGAVNTIVAEGAGPETGFNTDAEGFLEPLIKVIGEGLGERLAIVVGAGGAGRAIAFALASAHFEVLVLNRHPAKARDLTAAAGGAWWDDLSLYDLTANQNLVLQGDPGTSLLLVNATSLGMVSEPPLDLNLDDVDPRTIVYDIVYSPFETPLLADARRRGMRTIDGLAMLIGQAAAAFQHFFGAAAPREHDADLRELLTR